MSTLVAPLADELARRIGRVAVYGLVAQFMDSLVDANNRTARTLLALGNAIEQGLGEVGSELGAANAEIAAAAHAAVIDAYEEARGKGGNAGDYRSGAGGNLRRYAGGKLAEAIASSAFIDGDAGGINYGNVGLLNDTARQWARLNFGAGDAGDQPSPVEVRWSNLDAFSLGIDMEARPAFILPTGYFNRAGEYYPMGSQPQGFLRGGGAFLVHRREVKITGEHWLEKGLRVIADELGPAYLRVIERAFKQAVATGADMTFAGDLKRTGKPRMMWTGTK